MVIIYCWDCSCQGWIWTNRGWSNRHNWGIDAVATDPIDPDRVYAAVGMYTNDWYGAL